jgi:hypothetical protein
MKNLCRNKYLYWNRRKNPSPYIVSVLTPGKVQFPGVTFSFTYFISLSFSIDTHSASIVIFRWRGNWGIFTFILLLQILICRRKRGYLELLFFSSLFLCQQNRAVIAISHCNANQKWKAKNRIERNERAFHKSNFRFEMSSGISASRKQSRMVPSGGAMS